MKKASESLILAIDTATPTQSLAILRGSRVVFEALANRESKEGPGLLSLVDAALSQCELRIGDIDRFVVSRGPGAFTGVRVSMAMLKSFALTLDRPLYGLSSLDAIARTAVAPFCVTAACIDARRGEIYASFYREVDGRCEQITDELLLRPEAFGELTLKMFPDMPIFCIGTAFPHYGDCLTKINPSLCCRYAAPSAASLGLNMVEVYEDKLPDQSLESLEPRYIRIEDFATPQPFDFSTPGQFRKSSEC